MSFLPLLGSSFKSLSPTQAPCTPPTAYLWHVNFLPRDIEPLVESGMSLEVCLLKVFSQSLGAVGGGVSRWGLVEGRWAFWRACP